MIIVGYRRMGLVEGLVKIVCGEMRRIDNDWVTFDSV